MRLVLVLAILAAACSDDAGGPDAAVLDADAAVNDTDAAEDDTDAALPDAAPSADANLMPESLAESGLYADFASETLAPGVVEYQPRYALWSDGAEKRRWLYLPPGESIDTSDMSFWVYPVGTKVWKEFTSGGVRVETRLLYKTGPTENDWYMVAYAWNEEQTEALAVPTGVVDALGTTHDIPGKGACRTCHGRMPDRLLSVTAIQLDHDLEGLTLADLIADDRLSDPPAGAPPYFALPGSPTAQAAIGYLHANCGLCHNDTSDVAPTTPLRMWLTTDSLGALETTPVYATAVGQPNVLQIDGITALIEPGNPAASAIHARMATRGAIKMPPLASEVVDDAGLADVDAWIVELAP